MLNAAWDFRSKSSNASNVQYFQIERSEVTDKSDDSMWKDFAFNKMVSRPSQRWPTFRRPRISIISAASSSLQSFDGEVEKVCFL